MNGFSRPCNVGESGQFAHERRFGRGINHKDVGAEFHLAYVNHAIRTVKQKVDLRTFRPDIIWSMMPCIGFDMDA